MNYTYTLYFFYWHSLERKSYSLHKHWLLSVQWRCFTACYIHPHAARCTRELFSRFKWEVFVISVQSWSHIKWFSPFSKVKTIFGWHYLQNDDEVKARLLKWFNRLMAKFKCSNVDYCLYSTILINAFPYLIKN